MRDDSDSVKSGSALHVPSGKGRIMVVKLYGETLVLLSVYSPILLRELALTSESLSIGLGGFILARAQRLSLNHLVKEPWIGLGTEHYKEFICNYQDYLHAMVVIIDGSSFPYAHIWSKSGISDLLKAFGNIERVVKSDFFRK